MPKLEKQKKRLESSPNSQLKTKDDLSNLKVGGNLSGLRTEIKNKINYRNKSKNGKTEKDRGNAENNKGTFEYKNESEDKEYDVYLYTVKKGGKPNDIVEQTIKQGIAKEKKGILITNKNGKLYEKEYNFSGGDQVYVKIPKNDSTQEILIYKNKSKDGRYDIYSYTSKNSGFLTSKIKNKATTQLNLTPTTGIKITDIKGNEYSKLKWISAGEKVYLKIPKNTETNSGNFEYIKESKDGKYKVYSYIIKSGGKPNAVRTRAVSAGLVDKKDGILVTKRNGRPYEENHRFSAGDKVYVKILKKNITNTGKNNLDSRESSNKRVVSEQRMYDKIIKYGVSDKRQIAYILATAKHEAPNKSFGFKNQEEIGGRKKHYSPYYGRGFVQLTHDYNYKKFTKIIKSSGKTFKDNNGKTLDLNKIDLVRNPNIILESNDLSAFITVYGMKYGIFTGVKLDNYINDKKTDFINARRIINGKDKAYEIAKYANEYLKKLE